MLIHSYSLNMTHHAGFITTISKYRNIQIVRKVALLVFILCAIEISVYSVYLRCSG